MRKEPVLYAQLIPLSIALVSTVLFILILLGNTHILNRLFPVEPIRFIFRPFDLALGLYLYVKTSVDFAVFIGAMMLSNPGWKNRVAVEWGTSLGNFLGTIVIIWLWSAFRTVGLIFEGIIVLLASFVLLELAAGSMERLKSAAWDQSDGIKKWFFRFATFFLNIRRITAPFLKWMPDVKGAMSGRRLPNFRALFLYSFSVPFILGSDDFAGYISVFSVVNVLSFATGVLIGHGLLLAGMFAVPMTVETLMGNPWFSALAVTTFFAIFSIGTYDGAHSVLSWGSKNTFLFAILLIVITAWSASHKIPARQLLTTGWGKTRAAALSLIRKISPKRVQD